MNAAEDTKVLKTYERHVGEQVDLIKLAVQEKEQETAKEWYEDLVGERDDWARRAASPRVITSGSFGTGFKPAADVARLQALAAARAKIASCGIDIAESILKKAKMF